MLERSGCETEVLDVAFIPISRWIFGMSLWFIQLFNKKRKKSSWTEYSDKFPRWLLALVELHKETVWSMLSKLSAPRSWSNCSIPFPFEILCVLFLIEGWTILLLNQCYFFLFFLISSPCSFDFWKRLSFGLPPCFLLFQAFVPMFRSVLIALFYVGSSFSLANEDDDDSMKCVSRVEQMFSSLYCTLLHCIFFLHVYCYILAFIRISIVEKCKNSFVSRLCVCENV